jgi:hypothetical protein
MKRTRELFIDLIGPVCLMILAVLTLLLCSCASNKPSEQFHRSKFDMNTGTHPVSGQPAVRQTWYKRFWFWQRESARPNPRNR